MTSTFVGTVWVVLGEDLMEENDDTESVFVAKVYADESQAQAFADGQNELQDRFLYTVHERWVEDSRKYESE